MKLNHNLGFVNGKTFRKGEELSKEDLKFIKDSKAKCTFQVEEAKKKEQVTFSEVKND